jgi:alkylation response protein AidB-like acyl-CoA dehydrogenase
MNFTLDEPQQSLRDLAADLFAKRVDPDRLDKAEATADRFDRELWAALAESGLLGVVTAEEHGGLGFGAVGVALVLEQLGRSVAAVPLAEVLTASWFLTAHGTAKQGAGWLPALADGSRVVVPAAPQSTVGVHADGTQLSGQALGVAWAHVADALLLPIGGQVYLLDPTTTGVTTRAGETTARQVALDLELDGAEAEPVGPSGGAADLRLRSRVALAAVQAGVTDAALRMTASYTSEREQFGKPLSTFQAVALKAADAYLDATAIRATALQAAWFLDEGLDAELPALTAAWWAAEAGQHCVHLTQHLHGGMGADITYPVHRYFLWGKQIEIVLCGASALLAELGDALDRQPEAGDAVVL